MKHIFLPLSLETVARAWEAYQASAGLGAVTAKVLPAPGGCFFIAEGQWPRRFLSDLLKRSVLDSQSAAL